MAEWIPGAELSRRFYHEVVADLLARHYPDLPYAAALLGPGSEVLSYDTPMSRDHDWGPRLQIFLRATDAALAPSIRDDLAGWLPSEFLGYPVAIAGATDHPDARRAEAPTSHRVLIMTWNDMLWDRLRLAIDTEPTASDWLTFPPQRLLELTAGPVFHDAIGEVTQWRASLRWYPEPVWRYLMAADWQRIGQEEHLMPRAGFVGDELGAMLIGVRLLRTIMHLAFLQERCYPPYAKWFGTAFRRLRRAPELLPHLDATRQAAHWRERSDAIGEALLILVEQHHVLKLTDPVQCELVPFFDRPFPVIFGGQVAEQLIATIHDPFFEQQEKGRLIGGIDQWTDNIDLLEGIDWRDQLKAIYTRPAL